MGVVKMGGVVAGVSGVEDNLEMVMTVEEKKVGVRKVG
jgi:hypothetical protein